MKNRHFARLLLTTLIIAVPLGFVLARVGAAWRSPSAPLPTGIPSSARRLSTPPPSVKPPEVATEDKRTLKERAKEAGRSV